MDPLRPFAGLIRTLWTARTRDAATARGTEVSRGADDRAARSGGSASAESLQERLRSRLSAAEAWTPERRRQAFVETVLRWELTDAVDADPRFTDLVVRVAQDLGSDPQVSARLDAVLMEIRSQPA